MPPLDDATTPSGDEQQRQNRQSGQRRHTSNFQARQNHPTSYDESPPFRGPLVLGRCDGTPADAGRERIRHYYLDGSNGMKLPEEGTHRPLAESTPTRHMLKSIVDHLAHRDAPVDVKEVAESVEFYLRVRKRLLGSAAKASAGGRVKEQKRKQRDDDGQTRLARPPITVYDLCSGHGLTGMLFAACNPRTVRAVLVDRSEPPSHRLLRGYLAEVCPWTADGTAVPPMGQDWVQFVPATLDEFRDVKSTSVAPNVAADGPSVVISTHACGSLTDQVLEYAVEERRAAGVAVMPCCYTGTGRGVPYGVQRALGVAWSADIRRSFYLTERGYHSDFATIPYEITPMNRILVGERRGQ